MQSEAEAARPSLKPVVKGNRTLAIKTENVEIWERARQYALVHGIPLSEVAAMGLRAMFGKKKS